jgi:teichuronic acid biosynthesis glycosyltransferase TuaG
MKKPKVTIILPNFNSEDFLEQTINSIKLQTYKNWELIIIDDNSNLNTIKVLKKYLKKKKISIIFLKKNIGAGPCRNLGIKKSKSNFLAFIDSDDLWKKNKLKDQVSFMINNNLKFTYTNYATFEKNSKKVNYINCPKKISYLKFLRNTSIGTSTMMVEKKILGNIKFTNTKICEDFFFKCQILKKIKYAFCLNKYLTNYQIRKNSLQSKKLRNLFWILKINKKFNKLNIFDNLISVFFISLNSIKKYGLK